MRLKSVLGAGLVLGVLAFPAGSALAFDVVPLPADVADSRVDETTAAFARREGEYMRSFALQDDYARQNAVTQMRGTTLFLLGGRVSGEDLALRDERDPNAIVPSDPRDRTCWDCEQELVDGLWVLKPRR